VTVFALSWTENGRVRAAPLDRQAEGLIGRETGAAVALSDPTVSRRHALVTERDGRYLVENLSQTNPARLNDAPLDRRTELSDGDRIKAGSVLLFFHDLASHDALQGPVCSYCRRENKSTDKDCWYCGTSLVNALTLMRERRPVSCRVVAASGIWRDLYADQFVSLANEEALDVEAAAEPPSTAVAVTTGAGEVRLHLPDEAASVRVNGQPAEDAQLLHTGDDITVSDRRFTVVVRR
jgi:FHA domain-containing protein